MRAATMFLPERPEVLIAANPFSGTRPNWTHVEEFAQELRRHGLEPRIIWDLAERRALLCDPELRRHCRCVVAAGGDGTVAAVINDGLAAPLAVLPLGSENLLARQLGMNVGCAPLARAIARGCSRRIDLGRAVLRRSSTSLSEADGLSADSFAGLFSLLVSAGFDAEVVRRVHEWRAALGPLRRVNRMSYAKPVHHAIREYRHPLLELEADGQRVRGALVFVFNQPQYGARLPIMPHADGADGLLDWLVLSRPGVANLARYFAAVMTGRHLTLPDVSHGRARHLRITSAKPVPVEMDGDFAGWTPLEIEVVPQGLEVVAM